MKLIATAEHTSGGSVDHPCTRGIYSDPADDFQELIEAGDLDAAMIKANARLEKAVKKCGPCDCTLQREPGYDSWWNSVVIHLWPQDAEALAAWLAEGHEIDEDEYDLIPDELKSEEEEEDDSSGPELSAAENDAISRAVAKTEKKRAKRARYKANLLARRTQQ